MRPFSKTPKTFPRDLVPLGEQEGGTRVGERIGWLVGRGHLDFLLFLLMKKTRKLKAKYISVVVDLEDSPGSENTRVCNYVHPPKPQLAHSTQEEAHSQ